MTRSDDEPISISAARPSKSADIRSREIKYLVSMGIRTACFILAIVVSGPLRWAFVVAAFVLPYFAVVIANAASHTGPDGFEPYQPQRGALPPGEGEDLSDPGPR
jgi:Flp pilus assembly protein TadB